VRGAIFAMFGVGCGFVEICSLTNGNLVGNLVGNQRGTSGDEDGILPSLSFSVLIGAFDPLTKCVVIEKLASLAMGVVVEKLIIS
jgi:hypothetical protein